MTFSVITICYNPGPVVQSAVESVLGQSHDEIEYIIVDGGSSDGTVEWLQALAKKESTVTVVSEPDDGLYDALNKGVRLATGDVIGFVHADDFLAHKDVLKDVAECFEASGVEAVYGDLQYVKQSLTDGGWRMADGRCKKLEERCQTADSGQQTTAKGESHSKFERSDSIVRHWRSGQYDKSKLRWGWMPPHPTLYLKREVYQRAVLANGEYFDTSFSCAADYDFMMRLFSKHGVCPVYLPEVLMKMRVGGISNRSLKHIIRKSAEDWRAIRRNKIGHVHTLVWKNLRKVGQFLIRDSKF